MQAYYASVCLELLERLGGGAAAPAAAIRGVRLSGYLPVSTSQSYFPPTSLGLPMHFSLAVTEAVH